MRYLITIPAGEELDFHVLDDVDEDGRSYSVSVEGPEVVEVTTIEVDPTDEYNQHWRDFYETVEGGRAVLIDHVHEEWLHRVAEPVCLDESEDCEGAVEFFAVPNGNAYPRCAHHSEKRMDSYENSMERYAHSDVPPSWFDPSYAGERWDEDD